MEPLIALRGITKSFPVNQSLRSMFSPAAKISTAPAKLAVDGVTLDIKHGDRLGIVGRNGAGKSTLLRMIAGLAAPTTGELEIRGAVTSVMTLGVGLRDDLSGRKNIYVDGEIQGRTHKQIDAVVDEIVEFADLGEFIDLPVRSYSTGMKARLAFSMISHIDPEILIIDETLSVGDAAFSNKASARIREICARGKIVIVVSHSMQSIRDICNRCLWMENGRVVMDGPPQVVTNAYIDAIKADDEAQLINKFRKQIGARSLHDGWEITSADWVAGETGTRRVLLEAGEPVRLIVKAAFPEHSSPEQIGVQITRLDGVVFFDEIFSAAPFNSSSQTLAITIAMNPLVLGASVYRLDIRIVSHSKICATRSDIFEVFTQNFPSGGKPMLLYPVENVVIKSAQQEETM